METNQKITYGMIGILSVLVAGMGGTIYLASDQLENAYICSTSNIIVIADRLSSSGKTAYWTEDNLQKSKVCTNGIWLNLKQYAKDNNLNINQEPVIDIVSVDVIGNKYRCDSVKCEVLK